jgi:hypothetical protein
MQKGARHEKKTYLIFTFFVTISSDMGLVDILCLQYRDARVARGRASAVCFTLEYPELILVPRANLAFLVFSVRRTTISDRNASQTLHAQIFRCQF